MSLQERPNVTEHTDALIGNARNLIAGTGNVRRAVLDLDHAIAALNEARAAIPVIISLAIPEGDQTLSLAGTATAQLSAVFTAHDRVGEYEDEDDVVWSSSDEAVATVAGIPASGLVTAVAEGTATITATSISEPSFSASVTVTVTA